MQEPQNNKNLFVWQIIPPDPPRPQKFIDLDVAERASKDGRQTNDYSSQLTKKIREAAIRRANRKSSLPPKTDPAL